MFDRKWLKPMALAMSLPSSALVTAWVLWTLVEKNIISKNVAIVLLMVIILNILISMVVYAVRNNKKN
ncbi:hypothetical protein [Bacteriovorax sp. Seq25_V]|uniref:hypothetical protein n=1 Tax=Bacteriovorax sp. Seq25_V TaxID=1201288 RepID=UPI000389FAF9|nr:hypothetical protein [Bacteriovorax sp. Seq25_V]EQC43259.1 hypothetical protein M900_0007 [Bacteriovorax sp. Seq25_V]